MPLEMRVDRRAFSVASLRDDSGDRRYWWSRTPHERLEVLEALRRMNYGDRATARLPRVLEVAERLER
jgi:hypothetical protein